MNRIICLSSVDYDWMYQRPQQLMKELSSRGWEVIYCNKSESKELFLERRSDSLVICHSLNKLIESKITTDILWVVDPKIGALKGKFNERLMIYDCVDDFPFLKLHQHKMMKSADIVITTSKPLYIDLKKYKKEVYLVQNACDIGFFHMHKDIETGWKPPMSEGRIIGYIGALASWVDIGLVDEISKSYPSDNILMVGANIGISKLPKRDNITYLGQQSYELIPAFLNMMDVALIPFKVNQITRATNPIKMYEYLSLGKPIVSSLIPEVVPYKELIYISKENTDFIKNVGIALQENSVLLKEKRKNIAIYNSWKSRVDEIEEIISSSGKQGKSR